MDYKQMFSILDMLDEVIYITDINTYELVFINGAAKKLFNLKDNEYIGKKCYEIMQGRSLPCKFCSNAKLRGEKPFENEVADDYTKRHFLMKGRLIEIGGKQMRIELAIDLTKREKDKNELSEELAIARIMIECIHALLSQENLEGALNKVLESVLKYYNGDRAYIFEMRSQRQMYCNTYEQCAKGVEHHIDIMQNVPVEMFGKWNNEFKKGNSVIIRNNKEIDDYTEEEYKRLEAAGIKTLIAVPFVTNTDYVSFCGVNNPDISKGTRLLTALSYFIMNEITKRRLNTYLHYQIYHDSLTGIFNRTKYSEYIKEFDKGKNNSLGVVFADINGLKRINDSEGHAAGDRMLNEITREIKNAFDKYDKFRISGDEFVIICPNISNEEFRKKIKILKECTDSLDRYYGLAMGNIWTSKETDILELINEADKLMYYDKQRYYHENPINTLRSQRF